jgi:outer membrane receptor protein involved in Fe transport
VTAGVSYDSYQSTQPAFKVELSELNPKLGFLWQANRYLSFRAAGFKAVKSNIVVNQILQPTQIAGFNQFYDDPSGTVAWNYGVGMDAKLSKNLYLGAEAVKRDLTVPITDFGGVTRHKRNEEVYRFYLNWLLSENWVVNSEYRFENFRSLESALPKSVETSYLPLSLRYFHDWGLFSEVKGTWIHQSVTEPPPPGESFTSSFILLDAALGYRLPKSYGLISVEVKNLLDKQFQFRDRQFQMEEQRMPDFIPERTFFVRATLNW